MLRLPIPPLRPRHGPLRPIAVAGGFALTALTALPALTLLTACPARTTGHAAAAAAAASPTSPPISAPCSSADSPVPMTAAPTLVVYVKEFCAPCAAWLATLGGDEQVADLKARGVSVEVRVLGTRNCLEARRVVGNPPFAVRYVSDTSINNHVSATPTTELYLSGEQKLSYVGNRPYATLAHELDALGLAADTGYKSARR